MIIRHETPPLKCEICHQTDMFDFRTGFCLRCSENFFNVEHLLEKTNTPLNSARKKVRNFKKVKLVVFIIYFLFHSVVIPLILLKGYSNYFYIITVLTFPTLIYLIVFLFLTRCPNCKCFFPLPSQIKSTLEMKYSCRKCGFNCY